MRTSSVIARLIALLAPVLVSASAAWAQNAGPPPSSAVQIRFIDSATGYAVQPESIAARPHQPGSVERQLGPVSGEGGHAALWLERGRHSITATSPRHRPMSGEVNVRQENPYRIQFLLDPIEEPRELQADYLAALHRDDFTLIQGFVVDEERGQPLNSVRVRSLPSGVETTSDSRGFFQFYVPVQSDEAQARAPANLVFDKPGYRTEERQHLELWSRGDWTYTIRLERGGGRHVVDERTLRRRAPPADIRESGEPLSSLTADLPASDPAQGSPMIEFSEGIGPSATAASNTTVRVPGNIRVLRRLADGGTVDHVSLQYYARRVLPSEWLSAWAGYTGGSNSMNAGAVAVRSYAISRIHSAGPNSDYDICGTSSCQVYNSTTTTSSGNAAVNFTENCVMVNANGNIASTEYSAENNSIDRACGDGFTSPTGGCIYDPICVGESRFGHGRGMCQWGSARWATARRMAGRVRADGTPSGFPRRDWVWILQHYYPDLTLVKGAPLVLGDDVSARTTSNCHVRACPGGGIENGVNCALITTKSSGQTGVIIGGPLVIMADGLGFTWYQVQWNDANSTIGWSAENYLLRVVPTPTAPTALIATPVTPYRVDLNWTDTSDIEAWFEIERAPAASGPWIQIGSVPANVTAFIDNNLYSGSTWHYRVRAYNSGGTSGYTAVANATTPNTVAPVLAPIPNRTVAPNMTLVFTNSASAPEHVRLITDFEPFKSETANGVVLFRTPNNSSTTSGFLNGAPEVDIAAVTDAHPAGGQAAGKVLRVLCEFTGASNPWLRLTTAGTATLPNPVIDLTRKLQFDIYADKPVRVAVGCRETTTAAGAAIGSNGGITGAIEWAGVTNIAGTAPMPVRTIASNTWTRLTFDFPNEAIRSFSGGNGVLSTSSGLGVLEHLAIVPLAGAGIYNVYVDNFAVVGPRTFTYSLGGGAPIGASIHAATGVFTWTPTQAQSPSTNQISIVVTDNSLPPLRATNTFTVIVRENAPNSAPVLYPIEDRTIYAGSTLSFTNVAYDPDPGDILTFSLDAGAPPSATIQPMTGIFSWTTTHADTNSIHYITVRVTDDGTPPLSGAATFSVTVVPPPPPNNPPLLFPIEDRSVHAGSVLTFTNIAFDANAGDTLTFSLDPGAPLGAAVHPETGVFSWIPSDGDIDTVKQITVRVTDDGYPPMSGAATFSATVLPRLPNNPPVLAPIADWTVHAGSTITFTNSADDPDSADTLVFSIEEDAPLGAEIDLLTGVFTWTPSDEQSNTTNSITVVVSDDGEPPLSASASFTVIVRSRPELQFVSASSETAMLTWSAIPGTNYRVQYKNDLADPAWETLGPDVTASDSLASAMDSDLGGIPQRFYRIVVAD
jgi:hypothetical protein